MVTAEQWGHCWVDLMYYESGTKTRTSDHRRLRRCPDLSLRKTSSDKEDFSGAIWVSAHTVHHGNGGRKMPRKRDRKRERTTKVNNVVSAWIFRRWLTDVCHLCIPLPLPWLAVRTFSRFIFQKRKLCVQHQHVFIIFVMFICITELNFVRVSWNKGSTLNKKTFGCAPWTFFTFFLWIWKQCIYTHLNSSFSPFNLYFQLSTTLSLTIERFGQVQYLAWHFRYEVN